VSWLSVAPNVAVRIHGALARLGACGGFLEV